MKTINKIQLLVAIVGQEFFSEMEFKKIPSYERLSRVLDLLSERERIVVENRFALINPLTLKAIGLLLPNLRSKGNISGERVRGIELEALRKIRNGFNRIRRLMVYS